MRARALSSEAILEIGWCWPRRKSNFLIYEMCNKSNKLKVGWDRNNILTLIWDLGT